MKKTIFYIFIFIIQILIGCKNPVSSPETAPKEFVKFKVVISGDATITAFMNKSETDIASTVLQGMDVDIDTVIELEVIPAIEGRAVLWTGGDIDDSVRANNKIKVKIERDTEMQVVIGSSSSPIDVVFIDLLMSDNGYVLVNRDKHTSSSKIMLAKNQYIEMKAVADKSYYFTAWDIEGLNSTGNEYYFSINKNTKVLASFRAISIGSKLKLKISGGSVSVNGTTYTEDTEVVFPIGAKVSISASANTENEESGFVGWGGNINYLDSQDKNSTTVTMGTDIFLEPIFGKKTGAFYLSFNPPDSVAQITYSKTGGYSSTLRVGANSIENLAAGDIITLTAPSTAPTGYQAIPTWYGAGGYVSGVKTSIKFDGKSLITSVIYKPEKYSFTLEIERLIDAVDDGAGNISGTEETDTSVGGYSVTVDGITYRNVTGFTKEFDANAKFPISLSTGNNYTNLLFNGVKDKIEIEDFQLTANGTVFTVVLGHVARDLNLNIFGGKRTINGVDYVSSVLVNNGGYAGVSDNKEYEATGDEGAVISYPVKVLSGRNVEFTALLSGAHSFNGYDKLDVTNGNIGYFTNATWNKTINSTFVSSEIWDGLLETEPKELTAGTYTVNVPSELQWISKQSLGGNQFTGKTINIMLDLDMANKSFSGISVGPDAVSFEGTLNGKGKQIKNLSITAGMNVGLIGKLGENGKVDGVFVSSGNIRISGGYSIGSIVGSNFKGTVINCTNNAFIDASVGENSGGIVGYNKEGKIENSLNTGVIIGFRQVGGVVGNNDGGAIKNVGNDGKVIARFGGVGGNFFGGVAGKNISGTIEMSYNSAPMVITNGSYVGGIVGQNEGIRSKIDRVYNSGAINVKDVNSPTNLLFIGGLIGYDYQTAGATADVVGLSHSYNTGKIDGQNDSTGGIVGSALQSSKWAYVFNIGAVRTSRKSISQESIPGPVIGEVVDRVNMEGVYYLTNAYANGSASSGAGKYPADSKPSASAIDASQVSVSGMGLSSFTSIWEDKTTKDSLNLVKRRPMIKGLGEYNTTTP